MRILKRALIKRGCALRIGGRALWNKWYTRYECTGIDTPITRIRGIKGRSSETLSPYELNKKQRKELLGILFTLHLYPLRRFSSFRSYRHQQRRKGLLLYAFGLPRSFPWATYNSIIRIRGGSRYGGGGFLPRNRFYQDWEKEFQRYWIRKPAVFRQRTLKTRNSCQEQRTRRFRS